MTCEIVCTRKRRKAVGKYRCFSSTENLDITHGCQACSAGSLGVRSQLGSCLGRPTALRRSPSHVICCSARPLLQAEPIPERALKENFMLTSRGFGLILTAALLIMPSGKLNASVIFSNTLTNGSSCGGPGCINVSGLGTGLVRLGVSAEASNPPSGSVGPTGTNQANFPLYTLGPITPGTLTLSWFSEYDGDFFNTGSIQGTLFDLETGSPVSEFTWSCSRTCDGNTVSLPFNLGVPFSISLGASASASSPPKGSCCSGADEFAAVQITIAGVPEPAGFILGFSGLLGIGLGFVIRRARL
jgi:hypothetical protein